MSRQRHKPQGFSRTDRIADFIQRELANLIRTEMKDPRMGMVTIQDVKVARDLSYADVYFTLLGEDISAAPQAEEVLNHAAGFLRSGLAQNINTRITPRLRFHYDVVPERASQMEVLIRQARAEDEKIMHVDDAGNGDITPEEN